jgi:hypothetical protein
MQVNENPGGKLQLVGRDLLASNFIEKPGAREIPIIINGGQRNSKDL